MNVIAKSKPGQIPFAFQNVPVDQSLGEIKRDSRPMPEVTSSIAFARSNAETVRKRGNLHVLKELHVLSS